MNWDVERLHILSRLVAEETLSGSPPSQYHALWFVILPIRKDEGAPVTGYLDGLLVGQDFGQCIVRPPFQICSAPSKRLFLQKLFLSWLGKGKKDRTRYLFLLSFRWSPCVGNGSQNRQRNVQASKSALNILTSRWKIYIAFSSTVTKEGFPRLWHWNRAST